MSLTQNHLQFEGVSDLYVDARPAPPPELRRYLAKLVGVDLNAYRHPSQAQASSSESSTSSVALPPLRVLDLGCGTGVSTFYWDGYATEVIGVDPGDDLMSKALESKAQYSKMSFLKGYSHQLPVADESVDIVTCSQSFHWMDPTPTFKEIKRILKHGGVLAAYDYDIPMTVLVPDRTLEAVFKQCLAACKRLTKERNLPQAAMAEKESHLQRMQESGEFAHCREMTLQNLDRGDAARAVNLLLSMGQIATALSHGVSKHDLCITALEETAKRVLGEGEAEFLWSYRVRMAFK
jgi:ubiquinone/menaquinone biosynthesis C-methylase UbiE